MAGEEEESKEEVKGEAESSPEKAEAVTLSGLPKFEMRVIPAAASATSPEDGAADEKAAAVAKPRYVLLRFESE